NQDAAVGGSGDGDLLAQGFHGDAVADDAIAVAEFGVEELIFFLQAALLDGVANEDDYSLERQRLFDEVESAEFGGADGGLDGAVAGDDDDARWLREALDAAEGFHAVHAGEPDVEKDDFDGASGKAFEGEFGGFDGFDGIA